MSKAKIELTAEVVRKAIEEGKPASMTQLAHSLGYKGSVSGSLTSKLRKLIVGIDDLLAANKAKGDVAGLMEKAAKPTAQTTKPASKGKAIKTDKVEPKPAKVRGGKYPHDQRNPFREGSNYALVFDVLAAHPNGIERVKLVQLVATASGKPLVRSGFDCQVLLSAKGNDATGLSRNDGPRHRSCRPGFWVKRVNGNVQLVVDKED